MARSKDPKREEARRLFDAAGGDITNREIAEKLGVDERKLAMWKRRDGWDVVQQNAVVQQKRAKKQLAKAASRNRDLTEQQQAFCLHYIKSFNQTRAHMAAFGTSYAAAHAHAYEQFAKPEIQAEIKRLRELRNQQILADAQDVVIELCYYYIIAYEEQQSCGMI